MGDGIFGDRNDKHLQQHVNATEMATLPDNGGRGVCYHRSPS